MLLSTTAIFRLGARAEVYRSPVKRTKFAGGQGSQNHSLGFKYLYTLNRELKPEVRASVRFGGGVQIKLILFVSLGFCELLRWTLAYSNNTQF